MEKRLVICQRENLRKFFPKPWEKRTVSSPRVFQKGQEKKNLRDFSTRDYVSRNTSKRHLGCGVVVPFRFVIRIRQHTWMLSMIKLLCCSWSRLVRDHVVNSSRDPLAIRRSKFRCVKDKFQILPIYVYVFVYTCRICMTFKNPNIGIKACFV